MRAPEATAAEEATTRCDLSRPLPPRPSVAASPPPPPPSPPEAGGAGRWAWPSGSKEEAAAAAMAAESEGAESEGAYAPLTWRPWARLSPQWAGGCAAAPWMVALASARSPWVTTALPPTPRPGARMTAAPVPDHLLAQSESYFEGGTEPLPDAPFPSEGGQQQQQQELRFASRRSPAVWNTPEAGSKAGGSGLSLSLLMISCMH